MNRKIIAVSRLFRLPVFFTYNRCAQFILFCFTGLCCTILFPLQGQAQNRPVMEEGQPAVCEVKLKGDITAAGKQVKANPLLKKELKKNLPKNFKLESNEAGYFNRIAGIQPNERVPILISYPEGSAGEKVAILVQDGGTLDNGQKAKVAQLDAQKKIAFEFQVNSNNGLFRVMLRKGSDTKIIHLWVGAEPIPVKH